MGLISDIIGAATPTGQAASLGTALAGLADDIVSTAWPSPEAKQAAINSGLAAQVAAYVQKATVDMAPYLAQSDVDKVEASNPSWFVAGWRPALGWVCALGFFYSFLLMPIGQCIALALGYKGQVPRLDSASLMALTTGMLGLGTMHSYDLVQGTATGLIGGTSTLSTVSSVTAQVAGKVVKALPWKKSS